MRGGLGDLADPYLSKRHSVHAPSATPRTGRGCVQQRRGYGQRGCQFEQCWRAGHSNTPAMTSGRASLRNRALPGTGVSRHPRQPRRNHITLRTTPPLRKGHSLLALRRTLGRGLKTDQRRALDFRPLDQVRAHGRLEVSPALRGRKQERSRCQPLRRPYYRMGRRRSHPAAEESATRPRLNPHSSGGCVPPAPNRRTLPSSWNSTP